MSSDIRNKILETAARLFAAQGYAAVSMRRLATETGMTQANLYYHFKDKEDLVRSTLAYAFKDRNPSLEKVIAGGNDPETRLELAISWFARNLFEDAILAKLFIRELLVADSERMKFLTESIFQDTFSILVGLLEDYLGAQHAVLHALALTSTVLGFFQISGFTKHLDEVRPELVDPETISKFLMNELRNKTRDCDTA